MELLGLAAFTAAIIGIEIATHLVLALVTAGFCGFVAGEKGRNEVVWFILGALFSFIALLALMGLPSVVRSTQPTQQPPRSRRPRNERSAPISRGSYSRAVPGSPEYTTQRQQNKARREELQRRRDRTDE